jgi:hypothetical protein
MDLERAFILSNIINRFEEIQIIRKKNLEIFYAIKE